MPIFDTECGTCRIRGEIYTMDGNLPLCGCGGDLAKLPSFPAMVLNRGNGLYPSEQKHIRGSAPFTGAYNTKAWGEYDSNKYEMTGQRIDPDHKGFTD